MSNPISPKVISAAIGAGAGTIISTAILWAIGAGLYDAGATADRVDNAIAAVPTPLSALVFLIVTVACTFLPGYQITDPLRSPTRNANVGTGIGDANS